jgi:hypothetical protein
MKKPVHILVKRWFQATYGNTYFSATVTFDDGTEEKAIKFEYGYGDHGLQCAVEWLGENGYADLPAPYSNGMKSYNTTIFLRETLHCVYTIVDVQRKKDL